MHLLLSTLFWLFCVLYVVSAVRTVYHVGWKGEKFAERYPNLSDWTQELYGPAELFFVVALVPIAEGLVMLLPRKDADPSFYSPMYDSSRDDENNAVNVRDDDTR